LSHFYVDSIQIERLCIEVMVKSTPMATLSKDIHSSINLNRCKSTENFDTK
jgi:hypothetical protein